MDIHLLKTKFINSHISPFLADADLDHAIKMSLDQENLESIKKFEETTDTEGINQESESVTSVDEAIKSSSKPLEPKDIDSMPGKENI